VTPIKEILSKVLDICNSGRPDPALNSFSVAVSFEVAADGSIPTSTIKIVKTSGSVTIDKTAHEVLSLLGESHLLDMLGGRRPDTLEIKLADNTSHLAVGFLASTAEEARSKSDTFRFMLGVVKFAQKARDPLLSELLDHVTLKAEDKTITADLALPCSRASEMLQMLKSK